MKAGLIVGLAAMAVGLGGLGWIGYEGFIVGFSSKG